MKNSGFSLIELLVVIAIISILFGIAAISGNAWLKKYGVESQTKEMYVDLMNARARAMQRNRMHFVELTGTRYTVYEDTNSGPDGNGTPETALDEPVIRKDIPAYPIAWNGSGSNIIFDARGLLSGPDPERSVRVTDDHGSAYNCIKISATRIFMGAWNGSDCIAR